MNLMLWGRRKSDFRFRFPVSVISGITYVVYLAVAFFGVHFILGIVDISLSVSLVNISRGFFRFFGDFFLSSSTVMSILASRSNP